MIPFARRALTLALLALSAGGAAAAQVRIAIYHTNDIHGWIMSRPAAFYTKDPDRRIGGFPAMANALKRERLPRLLLDAGDWFQGTPEGTMTRGKAVAECMNAVGYDAAAPGNHDYDFGEPRLAELARSLAMPTLAANVYEEATGRRPPYLTPHVLKEVGGVKVGVFGLITTNMRNLTFAKNIEGHRFRREVDEAKDQVRALRAQGADVVVAVTHVGFEEPTMRPFEGDKFLAGEVPGIDLIVGGHTHTRLREPVRDPRTGALIVQAGHYLSQLGAVTLEVDTDNKRVTSSHAELIDLWVDQFGEDPGLLAIVSGYQQEADRLLSVVVGTASQTLTRDRLGESSLGDWMTDCARDWARTQIGLQNSGGIRADLPQGPVTLRRLFEIMPFDNYVTTFTMTGSQLREILEHGLSGRAGMLQIGGVSLRYDPKADPGKRLRGVRVGAEPMTEDGRYSVATVDFMVKGGDGYSAFDRSTDKVFTGTLLRDVLAWCAPRTSPIRAAPKTRIIAD